MLAHSGDDLPRLFSLSRKPAQAPGSFFLRKIFAARTPADRVSRFKPRRKSGMKTVLLPLRPFENHTDFISNAPKPICLAFPLPCIEEPSRVESTSSDIYLPIDHELFVPTPSPQWRSIHQAYQGLKAGWSTHGRTFPFDLKWKTLDGQTLVDYSDESVSFGSPEWMKLKRHWDSVLFAVFSARIDTFRCISSLLRFSFDV